MQLGFLPLVLSEVRPAPLPPALLYADWSKSCASPILWELEPPVKQISGLCGCILTEATKAAQATAHQDVAISDTHVQHPPPPIKVWMCLCCVLFQV